MGLLVALVFAGCGSEPSACAARVQIPTEARSCELLLEDTGSGVEEVTFGRGVVGEWVRQAPRTAIALHAEADASMGGDAITVRLAANGGYVVVASQCFDGEAQAIASAITDLEDGCHD